MADTIKIGNLDISSFKVGSDNCKIYLGDTLLYPKTPSYKLILTYNDSTEYKIECDGTSALTASEVSGGSKPSSAITSAVVNACGQSSFTIDTNAFYGCSGMTAITLDNAITTIGNQSFMGCSGLTSFTFPTSLKRIEGSCFRLCNQIKTFNVPNGVTYLGSGCFADMSALSAATIPATVTGTSTNLFLRDAALNNVHFLGTTAPALGADAFKNTGIQKIYIPTCDSYDSYAATAGMSAYTGFIYAEDETRCNTGDTYLTFTPLTATTFSFSGQSGIQYSTDNGSTWKSLSNAANTPTISAGSSIMWKGTLTPNSTRGIGKFSANKKFNIKGNPMSLLYGDNFVGQKSLSGKGYAFKLLFNNNIYVNDVSEMILPATTLASYCYNGMFYGCTAMTSVVSTLPSTSMKEGCYNSMYYNCKSLTSVPSNYLPSTSLDVSCYKAMFQGCTSLTNMPSLPATTLKNTCYQYMFYNCSGLTSTISSLPATTLTTSCYDHMFYGCSKITTAPELPATTLVDTCYSYMFYGCTKLNYIKALFTTEVTASTTLTNSWVVDVASSGTFVKKSSASIPTGNYGIPSGWSVQNVS